MLQHRALVVTRCDVADPAVEELYGLCARVDLHLEVGDGGVCELAEQRVPSLRLRPHERLAVLVVAGAVTLHRVARQRERRAREPDERHPIHELAPKLLDDLLHVAGVGDGIGDAELLDIGDRAHRVVDHGTLAALELQVEPHAGKADENVREHDRGVHAHEVDRLHRDLDRKLRRATHLEEAVLLANRAVLGHVAPGLPHHPHRRALSLLAPSGAEE